MPLYDNLISELRSLKCSDSSLTELKQRFTDDINSNRRLDNISTLEDLLNILCKRDVVNEINLRGLYEIKERLTRSETENNSHTLKNITNVPPENRSNPQGELSIESTLVLFTWPRAT